MTCKRHTKMIYQQQRGHRVIHHVVGRVYATVNVSVCLSVCLERDVLWRKGAS